MSEPTPSIAGTRLYPVHDTLIARLARVSPQPQIHMMYWARQGVRKFDSRPLSIHHTTGWRRR